MHPLDSAPPEPTCTLAGVCSGCLWLGRPWAAQLTTKHDQLARLWHAASLPSAIIDAGRVVGVAPAGLRDRVDLSLRRGLDDAVVLGLDHVDHTAVVDLHECAALSPRLGRWLQRFRQNLPNIDSAAVRLRVAPDGQRGVWLDCKNLEIDALLRDRVWLTDWTHEVVVELGQRHATVVERDGCLHRGDAEPRAWFETYVGDEQRPTPLFGTIGGFTQPGFVANRALVAAVRHAVRTHPIATVLELGAGNGNLTIPLASDGVYVTAVELDRRALAGLTMSLRHAQVEHTVRVHHGNLQRADDLIGAVETVDAVLADPPRAGLQQFLTVLAHAVQRPRWLIYVSCLAESLVADAVALDAIGYRLVSVVGLDLFPQSPHAEWVTVFELTRSIHEVTRNDDSRCDHLP